MATRSVEEVAQMVDTLYREMLTLNFSEQGVKHRLTMMYTIGFHDRDVLRNQSYRVEQLTWKGEHVNYFRSLTYASKALRIGRSTLSRIIDTDREWNGFIFRNCK